MKNSTKIKVMFADMWLQLWDKTIWTCYFIEWKQQHKYGYVFLKWDEDKIVGKSAFQLEHENDKWFMNEILLEDFGVLKGVEPLLPPPSFIDACEQYFDGLNDFIGWFDFKALINCKVINTYEQEYAPTITTTQERIPNSGIVIRNPNNLIAWFDKEFQTKEQLKLEL